MFTRWLNTKNISSFSGFNAFAKLSQLKNFNKFNITCNVCTYDVHEKPNQTIPCKTLIVET